jgi:hypothetical protein
MTVVAPVAASAIFMGSAVKLFSAGGLAQYALPGLSFYTLLVTSQFFTNAFGFDSHGAKLYFVAPVRGRDVIVGKNLALGGAAVLTVGLVAVFFHFAVLPVTPGVLAITALVTAIALLLMLATGNFLSILYPQATSPSKLSGSANGMQILLSLAWLVVISSALALGPAAGWLTGSQALDYGVYWLELAASIAVYVLRLGRASRLLERRGEQFLAALIRK